MQSNLEEAENLIREAANTWPHKWLTRKDAEVFSGGTISARTLMNMDSDDKLQGPKGAFKLNGRVCYPVQSFADFLIERLKRSNQL